MDKIKLSDRVVSKVEKMKALKNYKLIVELAQDAIFIKDLESRYVLVNQKTLEAFGDLSREEVLGKNDYKLLPPDQAKINIEDDKKVFKTGKPVEITKKMTSGDNEFWFQALKTPIRDNKGKVIGLIGIARDITEQKKAEKKYKYLFENSLDLLVCLEPSGNIIDINNSVLKLLGHSKKDVIGKHFSQFVPSKYVSLLLKSLSLEFAGKPTPAIEAEVRNKKGKSIFIEFAPGSIPLYEEKKLIGVVVSARDISDRKQLEKQLVFSERMAAVGQIAMGVSHEFNTLLAGIKDAVEIAKKSKRKNRTKESINKILQCVDRGTKITEDLASLSKRIDQDEVLIRIKDAVKKVGILEDPSSQLNSQIGQNIKAFRKQRNITIRGLAKRTGLSASLISQIENAKNAASISTLYKIARVLNAELSKLVKGV